ncbi:YIP1 family protein [Yoonia sp.]|uniref:YIP1 family protein n=1 Tax=Yoonia sp. TaxID=2212373 RepID=UPI0025E31BBE|nr:YIP1 family protein [Yoonia sp.]
MTLNFESFMRAIWQSIIDPAEMARRIKEMRFDMGSLWAALALTAVLNVLLLAGLQMVSPVPMTFQDQMITLTPFTYTVMISSFLFLFVFATQKVGQLMGGQGSLAQTVAIVVWFQAVSLTLEIGQLALMLFSPLASALFGMVSLGALLWCMVNFITVLHEFESRAKSIGTLVVALLGTAFGAGMLLALLGVGAVGGTI